VRARPEAKGQQQEAEYLSYLSNFIREQIASGTTNLYADCQSLMDRQVLDEVLKHTDGNLTQAAKILGITRATLRTKLTALNLPAAKGTETDSTE
jgi:two-component system nitrogen regulation response regulator GlnG